MQGHPFNSFRIQAHRANKNFPHTSVEINQRVGAYVKQQSGARVDLEKAEMTCWIEIVEKYALIYLERLPGPGGLPVGTSGKVVVLLSGGIDSPVAAWKMIKRGCTPVFVHFHSFPYTNKESQEKAKQIVQLLCHYALQAKIYLVPFAEVQRHIMVDTPLDTRVILYRRYMLRLAQKIVRRGKGRLVVTRGHGGEVASQNIQNNQGTFPALSLPHPPPFLVG